MIYYFLLSNILLILDVRGQKSGRTSCTVQKTCGECITAAPECAWCSDPNFSSSLYRCDYLTQLKEKCTDTFIVNPNNSYVLNKNEPPRNSLEGEVAIQLTPQDVTITMRPNSPYRLPVSFTQASNYPVDIYFLMDASNTMKKYKENLAQLANRLVDRIKNITSDYRLGFGSFVDKTTLPYISTAPEHLVAPCAGCVPPYGFKHHLSLSTSIHSFQERVRELNISGNLDAPEGGFDALVQSVVCLEKIGWRSSSRKMILLSTDAGFHYAGDGKLGGIIEPNDLKCHMDDNMMYTESIYQDYPSISQLSRVISERKVNVIFSVTENQVGLYSQLSAFIPGSNVGKLDENATNVVDLVADNYNKIRGSIELSVGDVDDVIIEFESNCTDNKLRKTSRCENIQVGQTVTFDVIITSKFCSRGSNEYLVHVTPVGLNEKLILRLKSICQCDCEMQSIHEYNSAKCSGSGTSECGICSCNPGFYGTKCECGSAFLTDFNHDSACRYNNVSDVCTGRGQCICGQCQCNSINPKDLEKRYSGAFCECSNYNCDYFQGKQCGGRGQCKCGACECDQEFTGPRCECPVSMDQCRSANGEICNNKGVCTCGVCECMDSFYKGPTCEDCPTCMSKCEELRECVNCFFRDGESDCKVKCSAVVAPVNILPDIQNSTDFKVCQIRDENFCDVHFVYAFETNVVYIQKTIECPERVSNWVIIGSVVGTIILIGLTFLIIFKIIVLIHDGREYAAFESEMKNAKWNSNENPLYKEAVSNFKNPTFVPKQHNL